MARLDGAAEWAENKKQAIEHEEARRDQAIGELQREIAALEASRDKLNARKLRVESYDPASGICPRCFIDDGRTVPMVNDHNSPPLDGGRDPMKCPLCGLEDAISP